MAQELSRRSFLAGVAATGAAVTAGMAATGAVTAAKAEEAPAAEGAAAESGGKYDILGTLYSDYGRGTNPDAVAATSDLEYIEQQGDGMIFLHFGGSCGTLGITPADFMLNKPAWLGDAPVISDDEIVETYDAEVCVVGGGPAGCLASLHSQDLGAKTICIETMDWDEYDSYICDMATYNSNFFLDKGTPYQDPMMIFNEYMRKTLGRANQKLIRDYATRSGEALDFLLSKLPEDIVTKYANASNYKGNASVPAECCGQYSFVGLCQWRDLEGGSGLYSNDNMWPYVQRLVMASFEDMGGQTLYGHQGICFTQDADGAITGVIAKNMDNQYVKINCKAAIVCAGDCGGCPDMVLDLMDDARNCAWSHGYDRNDVASIGGSGRDGSGTRMCLWAGATMDTGPRAANGGGMNSKPGFAFGGAWPVFGNDGKRFFNETLTKHGIIGYLDMLPADYKMVCITDSNWEDYLHYQGYGHETMNRSSDYQVETVRADMDNYVTGPDGFLVHAFSKYGAEADRMYAADTLEELCEIAGFEGEAAENLIAEVAHWNEMCEAGYDEDWGCDPQYLFPIKEPPFFFNFSSTSNGLPSVMVSMSGVCTNDEYNVTNADKLPIPGLYGAGNAIGQRYGTQYHTPTAGNCGGMAVTNGYCAAEYAAAYAMSH